MRFVGAITKIFIPLLTAAMIADVEKPDRGDLWTLKIIDGGTYEAG